MAARTERCIRCETQFLVPIEAQTVKCPVCHTIIQLRTNNTFNNPLIQAGHDSIQNAAATFVNVVNRVMAINTAFGSYSLPTGGGSCSGYSYYSTPQPAAAAIPCPWPGMALVPSSAYGRKRAVVCGVSYLGQKWNLKGSVNDVNCMKYFLVEKMGFPVDSILILTGTDHNYIKEITLLKVMLF